VPRLRFATRGRPSPGAAELVASPWRVAARLGAPAALVLAALVVLLGLPRSAAAQSSALGPLFSEEGAPLLRVSYTGVAEEADLLAPGTVHADVWLGFSNIFEQDSSATHVLYMDMERLITIGTVRVGVAERLEIGGRLTFETAGGGVLDPVIRWWHDRFHFGNANREYYPEHEYDQRLTGPDDLVLMDVPKRTLTLEDVRLFAKWGVLGSPDEPVAVSLRAAARLPTSSGPLVDERTDVALAALGRFSWERWHVHTIASASTVRAAGALDQVLRDRTYFLTLALERSLGASLSAIVQYSASSPLLHSFDDREIDRAATNLIFGVAGRLGERWRWDVSFQEDLPADTPAVDFTLGLRIGRTF
jgi:hypothetical protein